MTDEELRAYGRALADEAPPLTDKQVTAAALLYAALPPKTAAAA